MPDSHGVQVGQLRVWRPSVLLPDETPFLLVVGVSLVEGRWEACVLEGEQTEWYLLEYVEECSTLQK